VSYLTIYLPFSKYVEYITFSYGAIFIMIQIASLTNSIEMIIPSYFYHTFFKQKNIGRYRYTYF